MLKNTGVFRPEKAVYWKFSDVTITPERRRRSSGEITLDIQLGTGMVSTILDPQPAWSHAWHSAGLLPSQVPANTWFPRRRIPLP